MYGQAANNRKTSLGLGVRPVLANLTAAGSSARFIGARFIGSRAWAVVLSGYGRQPIERPQHATVFQRSRGFRSSAAITKQTKQLPGERLASVAAVRCCTLTRPEPQPNGACGGTRCGRVRICSAADGHDGAWPSRSFENIRNQMVPVEGRAAVASEYVLLLTATTERGPPDRLKTSASFENIRARRAQVTP